MSVSKMTLLKKNKQTQNGEKKINDSHKNNKKIKLKMEIWGFLILKYLMDRMCAIFVLLLHSAVEVHPKEIFLWPNNYLFAHLSVTSSLVSSLSWTFFL